MVNERVNGTCEVCCVTAHVTIVGDFQLNGQSRCHRASDFSPRAPDVVLGVPDPSCFACKNSSTQHDAGINRSLERDGDASKIVEDGERLDLCAGLRRESR